MPELPAQDRAKRERRQRVLPVLSGRHALRPPRRDDRTGAPFSLRATPPDLRGPQHRHHSQEGRWELEALFFSGDEPRVR